MDSPQFSESLDDHPQEALHLSVQLRGTASPVERSLFEQGFAVIGSASACQLRLDDANVPARALYVQQLEDRVVVVDLHDEEPGEAPPSDRRAVNSLPAGVPIAVGPYDLWQSAVVPADLEHRSPLHRKPLPSFPRPIAVWEIANVKGDESTRKVRYLRHAVTLVGRSAACRFRMVHDSISDIHASLVYTNGMLQVIDLCSEQGVCVNGVRVAHSMLQDGDDLRIGQCHGVIRWMSEPIPAESVDAGVPDPLPLEPVAAMSADVASEDRGIIVSLSDDGIDVRQAAFALSDHTSIEVLQYSEAECLAMVTRFLEMQQSLLEQTQLLMEKISDRLQSGADAALELAALPMPASFSSDAPRRTSPRKFQPAAAGHFSDESAPAPEFHAWLTHRLADLESSQRTGFSRLWERLTGQG